MVLAVYPEPKSEPLILDILTQYVLPAVQRTDLISVYEFNSHTTWIADKHFHKRKTVPKISNLEKELLDRIHNNRIVLRHHNQESPVVPFDSEDL